MATDPSNVYVCDSCGYRYDVAAHGGVDAEALPDDWACPGCQAEKDHLQVEVPPDDDLVEHESADDESGHVSGQVQPLRTDSGRTDVSTLYNRYKAGELTPQPDFQRYVVWPNQKQSRLIESLLLKLPIPTVYLAEIEDGKSVVVDGQQRLTSIFRFLDGQYALTGLNALKDLEGLRFDKLDKSLQRLLQKTQLFTVELTEDNETDAKYLLFARLNEGAVPLNAQELRNCVYYGPYNDYVKRLSENSYFRRLLKIREPHKRMVDVELTLRFLAFYHQKYLNHPDKKTGEFLDEQMRLGRAYTAPKLRQGEDAFKAATEMAWEIFGTQAFKPFIRGTEAKPSGRWDSKNNRALMDVTLFGFTQYPKGPLLMRKAEIRDMAADLLGDNDEFRDLISQTISEQKRVKRRFEIWLSALDEVMKGTEQGPRLFTYAVKKQLYESDPTCRFCRGQIESMDDAHVDHILPFAAGGKTETSNAALAHRYCNCAHATAAQLQV